jgi:hypothetical protein
MLRSVQAVAAYGSGALTSRDEILRTPDLQAKIKTALNDANHFAYLFNRGYIRTPGLARRWGDDIGCLRLVGEHAFAEQEMREWWPAFYRLADKAP